MWREAVPDWAQIIFGSGITLGSLCAILLNLVFHHVGKDFGPAVAGRPGAGVIRLDQVNDMTREQFVETFGRLVQGPQWVAERAYDQRPFADTHDLRIAFQEALFSSDRSEQHDLLTFYPDLGSDAVEGDTRSEESARDQGAVGLTLLNDEDHEQFAQLTQAYRERFGIPLIVSVRDVEKRDQILKSGWERMQNSPSQEHAAAIIEVAKIANHRFDDLVADASPILGARAANLEATPPLSAPPGARQVNERRHADRRCAAVQRACPTPRHGRRWRPAWRFHDGSTRCRPAAPTNRAEQYSGRPGHRLPRSPTTRSPPPWPGTPGSVSRRARDTTRSSPSRSRPPSGDADPAITDAIRAGNAEYESRFNRVFLIRATGRSATEILAELRRRLNNTAEAERAEVVTQLREIALTRLETVLA